MSIPNLVPAPWAERPWSRGLQDLPREHGFEALEIEGQIPRGLRGTLYRNGPALVGMGGKRYGHWFDGDGAISAVVLEDGKARGAVKLVATPALLKERKVGRMLYGGYGTRVQPWQMLRGNFIKHAANTAVLTWQGRMFALAEGGAPVEIRPEDLSTVGEDHLHGVIKATFSAHPHYVPARKATYNFGVRPGRVNYLDVYTLPDEGAAYLLTSFPLPFGPVLHDFIATPRHLVFFIPPVKTHILPVILGQKSLSEATTWEPGEGTRVVVIPLDDPTRRVEFETDAFYQWHFSNAWEEGERIQVELVRHPNWETNTWLHTLTEAGPTKPATGELCRMEVDLVHRTLKAFQLWPTAVEFPRIRPGLEGTQHRYTWLAAHTPEQPLAMLSALGRFDRHSGQLDILRVGEGMYPSEAVFVPRGTTAEDDGWLLSLVYDPASHRSHVAIWDTQDLSRGVIGRAWFDHFIPHTFHGMFEPARSRPV